ncbi:hypothetical protein Purlil1_12087 [Purpureocillium lilacinum]|uniref:F-box domain-containing protein n=1 Tax=Purpureocillium lilacinum TaxID=33203 RepID=A0ABR0BHU1_PURLI|nr:hypothetical protein Purlil1_12087 [Purpureocillium lilacinum]
MASIQDLPGEVLHPIFDFLTPQQLYSLCLVCKRFRGVAEPHLYFKIQMMWDSSSTPPIAALLRSILYRPHLASHVRTLVLNGNEDFYRDDFGGRLPPKMKVDDSQMELFEKAVQTSHTPINKELWICEMRAGTMDAFVTMLLSLLSSLRSLHIYRNFAKESRILGMFLRSCLCAVTTKPAIEAYRFQQLREVSFVTACDEARNSVVHNTADVLPLFYLPALQHLSVSISNPVTFSWPTKEPDLSRLISLDLTSIREAHLSHILKQTKALQSLRWEWLYDDNIPDQFNTTTIDLDQLCSALSHVRHTLTELNIGARAVAEDGGAALYLPPLNLQGSLKAIRDFDRLRVFQAPYALLLGFSPDDARQLEDALPRCVRHVTISVDLETYEGDEWAVDEIIAAIRAWLENYPQSTPDLTGLTLSLRKTRWGQSWRRDKVSEVEATCATLGIGFDEHLQS